MDRGILSGLDMLISNESKLHIVIIHPIKRQEPPSIRILTVPLTVVGL